MGIDRAISRSMYGFAAAGILALPMCASGQVTFRVTFDDPDALLATSQTMIESNVIGAGAMWSARLLGTTELWVEVRANPLIPTTECRAFTWSYLETLEGAIDIFETGASVHVRNGFPASSFDPDIVFEVNPEYMLNGVWFDPDPLARVDAVDSARIDAVSEFARGFGRAFAFDGWMNGSDGTFPGNARSVFDQLVAFDGTDFTFIGAHAISTYFAPVPMTFGDPFHVGNESPLPGGDLVNGLMGGAPLLPGVRYTASPLDFAILRDSRVPIILPCPCDLNHDGLIEDADFNAFTAAYNIYDCADSSMPEGCPCDFNADVMVDDQDYLIFVVSYEQFLCP